MGSRSWIEFQTAPQYFTVEFGNSVNNNLLYIAEILTESGYVIEIPEIVFDYSTDITEIRGLFNSIESNIAAIHNVVNWIDDYYKEFEWLRKTIRKRLEIQRWIDWLNGIKAVLDGAERWLYLIDEDGNYITDDRGYCIIVYNQQSSLLPGETLFPSEKTYPQFSL